MLNVNYTANYYATGRRQQIRRSFICKFLKVFIKLYMIYLYIKFIKFIDRRKLKGY